MKKSRLKKSYNVESFLRKKRQRRNFFYFTFTRTGINYVVSIAISAVFVVSMLTWNIKPDACNQVIKAGVQGALPFFKTTEMLTASGAAEMILYNSASPLFSKKKATNIKKEKITLPELNIKSVTVETDGIDIKNETDYSIDTQLILSEKINIGTKTPKVLIVHTHGSESYTPSDAHPYKATGNYRTQNENFNMIRIGNEIAEEMKSRGIDVIHDKSINDYPSYNDSYNKTQNVIESYLKDDSDIIFVFDIHRDAAGDENNILKFVTQIGDKSASQVMIVCGTDTNLDNPRWRDNLRLAVHIQNIFQQKHPGFMRPLNLRKERFNMHLTTGSLIFEVGTNGNTLDESLVSARVLGEVLADFIGNLIKQ